MFARSGWILLLVLLLVGCQGTSYSATCNNKTDSNISRCEINFSQLSGQWSRDINVSYIAESAETLPINLWVTIEQGSVRVSYTNEANEDLSYEVSSDEPLSVTGTVQVENDQARISFTALDLSASQIQAVVEVGPPA